MDNVLVQVTIDKLEEICEVLYKGDCENGVANMQTVIPMLMKISEQLDEDKKLVMMNEALVPMVKAMEDKDAVSLADVIKYELLEFLAQYK